MPRDEANAAADPRVIEMPCFQRLAQTQGYDAKARTFELTWAAGAQVRRYDFWSDEVWIEELDMSAGACDLTRLNDGAPLLNTHQRYELGDVLGVVERAWLKDGVGMAQCKFSSRADVQPIAQDVADRVIRNVSVGYEVLEFKEVGRDKKTGYRIMRATSWVPFEISLVPIGADPDGKTRSDAATPGRRTRCNVTLAVATDSSDSAQAPEGATREQQHAASAVRDAESQPASTAEHRSISMTTEVKDAPAGGNADPGNKQTTAQLEDSRRNAIQNLCKANKLDERFARNWIANGTPLETVSEEILKVMEERGKHVEQSPTFLGMERNEVKQWSLFRAINALVSGNWDKAGLELAASRAVQDKTGRGPENARGLLVPMDVLSRSIDAHIASRALLERMFNRDLTAASPSGGGYLVETTNQGFVELLRNASVCYAMGARRLDGLQGNVTIPKRTAGATGYWLGTESTQVTESGQTFGQIAMTPKTVGAYNELSRQLLMQSSPSAEDLVMSGLALDIGIAVDLAGLNGSGNAGQPLGVINTSGIGAVTGTSFDYADIVEFQTDVATANALSGALGYVTTPTVAGLCKTRVKFTSTASPLWEGRLERGSMDGYPAMSSNQMPAGDMLFGDWSQLVIGAWGVLELAVNQNANFQAAIIGVRALSSVDIAVRIPAAFSLMTSAT